MPSLAAVRAANAAARFTANPVNAVFVGGTSGIGRGMASALARATKGNARIVIVGRNQTAAQELIASFPSPANTLSSFVSCDVTLMRNVHAAAKTIQVQLPTINYLVISAGFFTLNGRTETEEGIDRKLAAHYYARWAFINDLLPQVRAAAEKGEEAKVLSVLSAGHGGPVDLNDLGLKRTYSLKNAAYQGITYNDLALEVRSFSLTLCPIHSQFSRNSRPVTLTLPSYTPIPAPSAPTSRSTPTPILSRALRMLSIPLSTSPASARRSARIG